MSEIANPHDLLFQQMLSSRETAQDFLRSYLPEAVLARLDLESLEMTGDSVVDSELRRHVSDLVYRANLVSDSGPAYLYVLFEHKSQPDGLVALQLLRYMSRLWERMLDEGQKPPLPPVVPLVFYHGHSRWRVSTEFSALIRCPAELEEYTPRFRYALVNLSLKSREEIRGEAILRAVLRALRHAFDEDLVDLIPWILAELRSVARTRTGRQAVQALLRYFSAVGDRVDERVLREAVMQLFPAEGDRIMATLAEKWMKDGVEQGVQQGLRQGAVATAQEFLLEVLTTRFRRIPDSLQQLIRTTADVTVLRKLVKAATTAESIERFREELETARGGA